MISFLFVCCLSGSERSGLKISVHLLFRLAFKSRRRGAENEGEAVASMDNLERSASLSILKIFKSIDWAKILPSLLHAHRVPGCSDARRKS